MKNSLPQRYPRTGFLRVLRWLLLVGWSVVGWYVGNLIYDIIHLSSNDLNNLGSVLTEHVLPFPFVTDSFRPWAAIVVTALCLALLGGSIWAVVDLRAERRALRARGRLTILSVYLWPFLMLLFIALSSYALYADIDFGELANVLRGLALILAASAVTAGAGVLIWNALSAEGGRSQRPWISVFPDDNNADVSQAPLGSSSGATVSTGSSLELAAQYHTYVGTAQDHVRLRETANFFYTALLSVLAISLLIVIGTPLVSHARDVVAFAMAFLGIMLSLVWRVTIFGHRRYSITQYVNIRVMESRLPARPFLAERNVRSSEWTSSSLDRALIRGFGRSDFLPSLYTVVFIALLIAYFVLR